MDKHEFHKDIEAVLEKHGMVDHFLVAINLNGEARTSVRFGGERGPSESNYARRKNLLGYVEDQKLVMYTSQPGIIKKPENVIGCPHGIPNGLWCLQCEQEMGL